MTDLQLTRDVYGKLPYLSHWSRYQEPAVARKRTVGNTDHWSKMKHKASNFVVVGGNGKIHGFSADRCPHETVDTKNVLKFRHDIDGSLKHIGTRSFTDMMLQELNGFMPGDRIITRKIPGSIIRTAANDRARDGFQYWYREKKRSTADAKVWAGQKGSTLGISSF